MIAQLEISVETLDGRIQQLVSLVQQKEGELEDENDLIHLLTGLGDPFGWTRPSDADGPSADGSSSSSTFEPPRFADVGTSPDAATRLHQVARAPLVFLLEGHATALLVDARALKMTELSPFGSSKWLLAIEPSFPSRVSSTGLAGSTSRSRSDHDEGSGVDLGVLVKPMPYPTTAATATALALMPFSCLS